MRPHVLPNGRSHGRKSRQRVAVIGAGIMGLAHAWAAAKRGYQVLLFERDTRACRASVRNFGMVWPIGQPNGPDHRIALHSRELWREFLRESGIWHNECGSLHLACRDDELAVLEEFATNSVALGYDCQLLTPTQVHDRSPAARRDGLLGGLSSATELCVDPRQVIADMPGWLHKRFRVELHFDTAIEHVSLPWVVASDGNRWQVDRVVVATGADMQTLYPSLLRNAGFRLCKLQMLRTVPQHDGWRLGPMLAGGLTLRHYANFAVCHALHALKERIARETPELDRYGIHVMVAQNGLGEVILGDSHEYGDDITPFDKNLIDELILRELRTLVALPDWTIQQRWHGIYPQLPGATQFVREPEPGVTIAIASGGCGMTMSFGLADEMWNTEPGESIRERVPSAVKSPLAVNS